MAPTPLLSRGVLSIDIPDLLLVRKPTTELSKWGLVPPAKRGGTSPKAREAGKPEAYPRPFDGSR